MNIDLDQATGDTHITSDVCIVGAGIAGLTLANALRNSGLNVVLLEGGGLTAEQRSQELYDVEIAGHPHTGATKGRFRIFGGSSTQWGGQLLAYPEDVFNPPPTTAMPAWPIQRSEIEPFYPAVLRNFGVPDESFEPGSIASGGIQPPVNNPDVNIRFARWASFSQRNLASTLGKQCSESRNISIYFHANVTHLEPGGPAEDVITQVHATSFTGRMVTFSARQVVICLGVIESVRLLLASRIGNATDQVGRYFHDHIGVHAATLQSPARETAIQLFAPRINAGVLYTPKLEATAKWRNQFRTPSVMAHFPIVEPEDSPIATVKLLLQALQRKQMPPGLFLRLAALPMGSVDLFRLAYSTKVLKRRSLSEHAQYRLNIDVEQHPLPDSRISLSTHKDRFGVPRARLDWKIGEPEARAVRLFARKIRDELSAVNVAPIDIHPALWAEDGDWLSRASDTYHMMGGTRMGTAKVASVVDTNLKVHGIQNLYVASCSVFPSGGSSNPTFTMMALTLRLAKLLQSSSPRP